MLFFKRFFFQLQLIIGVFCISCNSEKKMNINDNNQEVNSLDITKMSSEVYTTAHDTLLTLSLTGSLEFQEFQQPKETDVAITVDPGKQFQTFLGIGAALTDASAETFYKLPKENQDLFMESYFNQEKGIGFTLARTHIHSCDFSSGSYTYIEEGDSELKTFNIDFQVAVILI